MLPSALQRDVRFVEGQAAKMRVCRSQCERALGYWVVGIANHARYTRCKPVRYGDYTALTLDQAVREAGVRVVVNRGLAFPIYA